jgi:hypothetical protein
MEVGHRNDGRRPVAAAAGAGEEHGGRLRPLSRLGLARDRLDDGLLKRRLRDGAFEQRGRRAVEDALDRVQEAFAVP